MRKLKDTPRVFNTGLLIATAVTDNGEGATLSTHRDRYTERFSEFMLNGGIRRLQRHGLKADGNYGKIDNLHISYNGNRITTVLEDADPVTQSGSMDYPGAKREMRFGYNDWGALVSDESRGIEAIEYDNFGNPVHIKFSGRDYTKNVYSATGVKLATEHYTHPLQTGPIVMGDEPQPNTEAANAQIGPGIISPEHHLLAGQQKIEYRGPVIYRNFKIDMVLFPGGYATIGNDNAVTFHYYTQDYLGNNRAVVNGSTEAVEQTTAYYPYGAVIPDLGTGNSGHPFKFGGKELVSANGLNAFDFGARLHYPAIPQFDRIDPMCESYYPLSPYLYCANNPVNAFDPDGTSTWVTDLGDGKYQVIGGDINDNDLNVYVYTKDENGNKIRGKSIGVTATIYSFYNSGDEGNGPPGWNDKSIIDMNDNSGAEFLSDLASSNPPLASDYIPNAKNNMRYDFKATNGTSEKDDNLNHYRGMPIGKTEGGVPILASARDVGNIGAGYMVAVNGFTWNEARTGFDVYQSKVKPDQKTEGITSQTAQWYGYRMGRRSTTFCQRTYIKALSFIDAIEVGIRRCKSLLK